MENDQPVQQPIFSSYGMSLSLLNLNKKKALRQIFRTSKLLSEVDIETNLIKKSIINRLETFKAREKSIDQQAKQTALNIARHRKSNPLDEGSFDTDATRSRRQEELMRALDSLDRKNTVFDPLEQQTQTKKTPFPKVSKCKLSYPLFEKPAHLEHSSDKWPGLASATFAPFANETHSNSKSAFFGLSKRMLPFEVSAEARTLGEDPKKLKACKRLPQPDAGLCQGLSSVSKLRGIINYDRMLGRPDLRRLSFPESGKTASKQDAQEHRRATHQLDSPLEDRTVQDITFRKMEDSKHQASCSSLNSIREKSAMRASRRKQLNPGEKPSPFALQLGRQARHKKHSTRDSKLSTGDVCYNLVRQASPSIKIKTGDYFGPCRVTITSPKVSKPHFIITRKIHI